MENQGVTSEQLAQLRDKKVILQNVMWKPDKDFGDKQLFLPYLSGDFVKRRLIEVLGAENLQFMLEKDEEFYAKGSIGVFFAVKQDWNFFSAIGVEKEGRGLTGEKLNKVKFKGNVTDTMKSCAEWLGLMIPEGLKQKTVKKEGDFVISATGQKVGNVKYDQQKINNYLNGISNTRYIIGQLYQLNKETFEGNERLKTDLENMLKALGDGK